MQMQSDKTHIANDINTRFFTREGYYCLVNSPEYFQRFQRVLGFSGASNSGNATNVNTERTFIKISLVTINENDTVSHNRSGNIAGIRQHAVANRLHDRLPLEVDCYSNCDGDSPGGTHRSHRNVTDTKICFNLSRDLFVYNYDEISNGPEASVPIYKRSYKSSSPSCHDFNQATATSESISLLVGFAQGQVQLIDLNLGCGDHESCKEFNVDRAIDKTRVTCIKWLPYSPSLFLVAHASGHLYLYKDDLPCGPAAPTYQLYKQSDGVIVYTCKSKTTRNPIYRWTIGGGGTNVTSPNSQSSTSSTQSGRSSSPSHAQQTNDNEMCSLNEFAFSPCAKYLACVSQDGFLRVFSYDTMELIGRARSYYGGLTCVSWSPDGKYVATGGEDDLITVWSFIDRRVVARGIGHKSWVTVVSFDSYYIDHPHHNQQQAGVDEIDRVCNRNHRPAGCDHSHQDIDDVMTDDGDSPDSLRRQTRLNGVDYAYASRGQSISGGQNSRQHSSSSKERRSRCYRLGSVGQDTQLCFWDLYDDQLTRSESSSKVKSANAPSTTTVQENSSSLNITTTDNAPITCNHLGDVAHNESCPARCKDSNANQTSSTSTQSAKTTKTECNCSATKPTEKSKSLFLSSKGSSFTKTFSLVGKRDKRNASQRFADKTANKSASSVENGNPNKDLVNDPSRLLGTPICPRMSEVPLLEPTVCKKIAFERLTSLVFSDTGFISSCQDGCVFFWCRPSQVNEYEDSHAFITDL